MSLKIITPRGPSSFNAAIGRSYATPAVAECKCGARIQLDGDTTCDSCDREYNICGQELRKGWSYNEDANEANDYRNEG